MRKLRARTHAIANPYAQPFGQALVTARSRHIDRWRFRRHSGFTLGRMVFRASRHVSNKLSHVLSHDIGVEVRAGAADRASREFRKPLPIEVETANLICPSPDVAERDEQTAFAGLDNLGAAREDVVSDRHAAHAHGLNGDHAEGFLPAGHEENVRLRGDVVAPLMRHAASPDNHTLQSLALELAPERLISPADEVE